MGEHHCQCDTCRVCCLGNSQPDLNNSEKRNFKGIEESPGAQFLGILLTGGQGLDVRCNFFDCTRNYCDALSIPGHNNDLEIARGIEITGSFDVTIRRAEGPRCSRRCGAITIVRKCNDTGLVQGETPRFPRRQWYRVTYLVRCFYG